MELMGRVRSLIWAGVVPLLALLVVIAQSGCSLLPTPQTAISGHIYGDPLVTTPLTTTRAAPGFVPLAASITCNAAATTAAADGSYRLSADRAERYSCTISAANYVTVTLVVTSAAGSRVHLDLGALAKTAATATSSAAPRAGATPSPGLAASCTAPIVTASATCPPLHLEPGTISGVVTSADTQEPVAGASVTCWQPTLAGLSRPPSQTARTSAAGAFSIAGVPAGLYGCVVAGDPQLYSGTVQAGGAATVAMQACRRHCPPVTFHNGSVMHEVTAYLIFWLPGGHTFEPAGSDSRFEALMAQFMRDLGGTPFYGLLSQYWDHQGSVANTLTLGGTYVDTTPYPHAGTHGDPLSSDDIESQIDRVAHLRGWRIDGEHEIIIFTGYDVQSCANSGGTRQCSFSSDGRHYCAFHSDFESSTSGDHAIYSYLPVLADCVQIEELSISGSPNHDALADAMINSLSHEHFEAVTDPYGDAWYDGNPASGEIADKCEYRFGAIHAGGGNVTLAHAHSYLVQEEWSDRTNGCALQ
jgi:hypothetical protein